MTKVGNGTIAFAIDSTAQFSFTLNGVAGSKTIRPQPIGSSTTPPVINYTDLWWAGEGESGWGITLTQQSSTIFATWFTYDAQRNPIWYVAPSCVVVEATCTSDLFRVNGGSPLTVPWTGQNRVPTLVGNIRLAFMGPGEANFNYTIGGVPSSRVLSRQPF